MKPIKIPFLLVCLFTRLVYAHAQPIDTLEVHFKSGLNTLHGKLLTPRGKTNLSALVFLVGSSGNSSYQSNYKQFLREILEQPFGQDMALLYFDKQGINRSEGNWHTTDFYGRADDAISAVRYLKTLKQIDPARIGVIGHSQGGWICQLVASQHPDEIAFAASLAGPTVSVVDQLTEDYESQFKCKGLDSLEAHRKAVKKVRSTLRLANWFGFVSRNLKQLQVIKHFDPAQAIKGIRIAFLFAFAENDQLVYPANSLKRLTTILGTLPTNIQTVVIPNSNHSFLVVDKCFTGRSSQLSYSNQFKNLLAYWVRNYEVGRLPQISTEGDG